MQNDSPWEMKEKAYKGNIAKLDRRLLRAKKIIHQLHLLLERRYRQTTIDSEFKESLRLQFPEIYNHLLKEMLDRGRTLPRWREERKLLKNS